MTRYKKEDLERLILSGVSYEEIGRVYGVSGNSIKKAAKRRGILLPVKRKINPNETFNNRIKIVDLLSDDEFISIVTESSSWIELLSKMGYSTKGYPSIRSVIKKRCISLGIKTDAHYVFKIKKPAKKQKVYHKTKSEIFENAPSWQAARSSIQKNARAVFFESNPSPSCLICGYSNHIEVCHIESVSNFSGDALVMEINSLSNLVALCPNHHWELDNGLLKI